MKLGIYPKKQHRPSTVNVIYIPSTDQYIITSNETKFIHEKTALILDDLGNYNTFNRGCAEVSGVSIGFDKGLDMNGAVSYCSYVRGLESISDIHGKYHEACNVCGPLLKKLGIKSIEW